MGTQITVHRLDAAHSGQLGELLDRQQAGTMTSDERFELLALMRADDEGMLRKSAALAEAVRRGLRTPPAP